MGVKIVDLPAIPATLKNEDLFPVSEDNSGVRDTYKISAQSVASFINTGPYQAIADLESRLGGSTNTYITNLSSFVSNNFVHLSGDTMQGDLNLASYKIKQFSGDITTITTETFLTSAHNGKIILVEKSPKVNPDDRVLLKIDNNTLPLGFNALIIQTGDIQAKITNPDTNVDLVNADNSLSTRQKYSQMNVCVIKKGSRDMVWISGDIV
jgi:hypothetical protein